MSGSDLDEDEAKALFGSDAPEEAEARDSELEVEPEVITSVATTAAAPARPTMKSQPQLPPPPPSIRAAQEGRPLAIAGEPKLARDLMTRQLFTIGPDDTLGSLEEQMQALHFRHLPVVEGKKVIGLISYADLLHASSSFLSETAFERNEIIHKVPVRRVMKRGVTMVRPTEPLADVAAAMWKSHADCVVVTDADSELIGIITQADFVRLAHHFLSRERPE